MSWIMLCQPYKTMAWTIQDERTNLRSPWIPFLPKKRDQEACLNPRNSSAVVYYMCAICVCSFLRRWYDVTICEWMIRWMCITKIRVDVTPVSRFFFTSETPHITGAKLIKAGALAKSFLSNLPWREPHSCQMTKESYDLTVLTKRELRSKGVCRLSTSHRKMRRKKSHHPPLPPACRTRGPHCHKVAEFTRMWSHVLLYRTFQVWYPNSLSSRCKVVVFGHKSCGTWIWPDIKLHLRDLKALRWALK